MIEVLPKVGVVILNWNGEKDTVSCLASLLENTYQNTEYVLVDNGSEDNSVDTFKTLFPDVHLIETGENLGYAGGNNIGIKYALKLGVEYVLVINNDTFVDKHTIIELLDYDKLCGAHRVVGPVILYTEPENTIWFGGASWNSRNLTFDFLMQDESEKLLPKSPYKTDYVCGAAMFFHRSIPEKIGLLDERFFLVWEESDWCLRARKYDIECFMVPSSRIWHKVGASFGTESSPLREYFSYRNKLLWAEKNLELSDRIKILLNAARPFFPRFAVDNNKNNSLVKRILWAFSDLKKNWNSIFLKTKRRAVLDYVFRRFGNCPDVILQYQTAWVDAQSHDKN